MVHFWVPLINGTTEMSKYVVCLQTRHLGLLTRTKNDAWAFSLGISTGGKVPKTWDSYEDAQTAADSIADRVPAGYRGQLTVQRAPE